MKLKTKLAWGFLLIFLLVGLISVSSITASDTEQSGDQQQQQPEAMPVNVSVVIKQDTQIWKNFSARLAAVDYVELRPQVSGTIIKVNFEDGQNVNEGDVIFVIDPAPYLAEVNQARADLETSKADSEFAIQQYMRAQTLIKTNAISKRIYDERKSAVAMSKASILSSKAKLERAKINLDRAYVKAPISGRLGRIEITQGNVVENGANSPILTTIISDGSIYADFEMDEQFYIQYIRSNARNKAAENKIPVRLKLNKDENIYEGSIYTFDNRLDATSGTIRARALFENKDGVLLPGMFAHVEIGSTNTLNKIFIDEKAVGTDQDRRFVYIVDQDNKVGYRELKLGATMRGQREVISGLAEGDKVILDGIMFIRVGMEVIPTVVDAPLETNLNDTDKLTSSS
tara:strand:- start:473 stop:1675 length:1203 start_codon:yes stop_codon:yes gene_type:complete